jgi:hypothetical protein
MDQLITDILDVIKDYREDAPFGIGKMNAKRIKDWIAQFEEYDREFILSELKNIFEKRYCSKAIARKFLKSVLEKLKEDFNYQEMSDFLAKTHFLDLQEEGKSQKAMLKLMKELVKEDYQIKLIEKPTADTKHYIYIDDVMCTGTTLFEDIKQWCETSFDDKTKHVDLIKQEKADFICAYIFLHEKNYYKKIAQLRLEVCPEISSNLKMYRLVEVENDSSKAHSKLDLILPLEEGQPEGVFKYKEKIIQEVDERTRGYAKKTAESFFRNPATPAQEKLFSSPENRRRFENIMLTKGIEILNRAHVNKANIRALGFSLPSHKDFGFGALCFTWRNIANNTPLVFWYSGGNFRPLFTKK